MTPARAAHRRAGPGRRALAAAWAAIACAAAASSGGPTPQTPPHSATPPTSTIDRWSEQLIASARELHARAARAAEALIEGEPARWTPGLYVLDDAPDGSPAATAWSRWPEDRPLPERLVLLVHGLDEPGGVWDVLAPALHRAAATPGEPRPGETAAGEPGAARWRVARFEYPNDQGIADSTALLLDRLRAARRAGVRRVDIVAHSMGGLVARDALTRSDGYAGSARGHADLPDVPRLIMIGTPNAGSAWARLRIVSEVRDQVARWIDAPPDARPGVLQISRDGDGQAGRDLLPGSAFLADLNARPMPEGVAITVIAGILTPPTRDDLAWIAEAPVLRDLFTPEDARRASELFARLHEDLGDGVVPLSSARLAGVEDTVILEGSHRGLLAPIRIEQAIRGWTGGAQPTPPAVPVVLDRLARTPAD